MPKPKLTDDQIDALLSLYLVIKGRAQAFRGVLPGSEGMMSRVGPPTSTNIGALMAAYDKCVKTGLDDI